MQEENTALVYKRNSSELKQTEVKFVINWKQLLQNTINVTISRRSEYVKSGQAWLPLPCKDNEQED
jgi:hypothetical protein